MIPAEIQRFASVGVLATCAHLAVALAAKTFGLGAQHANIAGFCAAFGLSYLGHARFTFQVTGNHAVHMSRFMVTALAGLMISAGVTYLVHERLGAPFVIAMAAVAIAVPVFTYLGARFWAFAEVARAPLTAGRVAVLGFGAGYFALLQGRLINHDTGWYLVATRKWQEGARLYVDLIEVNPPLNFYYTRPALWLADGLGLSDIQGQVLLTAGLITASLFWVWTLLERAPDVPPRRKFALLAGTAFALTVPYVQDYSQREHLLAIVVMPWLFAFALGTDTKAEAARAAFAGLGLCLKPHFMLIPIAITLVRCVQTRSARPIWSASNLVILAMGLAYIALVKLAHPEYLNVIVPMATKVYGAYGFSAAQVVQTASPAVMLTFLLLLIVAGRALVLLGLVAAACVGFYAAQWTGYGYQIAPAFSVIAVACMFALSQPALRMSARVLAVLCLGLMAWNSAQAGLYRSPATQLFKPHLDAAGPGASFAVFSSSLWPAFPLALAAQADWISRYPALWLIPGALNRLQSPDCAQGCPHVEHVLEQTRRDIVTDFVQGAPDVLIIDQNPFYIDDPDFTYTGFLSRDPRFAQALAGYTLVEKTHGFEVMRAVNP